jgi:hypothetical protein
MALIVITIRDMDDGTCAVQLQDEPHVQEGQTEFTPAQHVATAALNAIHAQLNDKPRIVDLDGDPLSPKTRKLIDRLN